MHAIQAANIINKLIFRPGWHFEARPVSADSIVLDVTYRTQDTDYPPNYPRNIVTGPPPVYVRVANLDEDEVVACVKQRVDFINDHEDREFLRRGDLPGMPAPFHPHHRDGDRRYQRALRGAQLAA